MFWKKRVYRDPKLGELIYSRGLWSATVVAPNGDALFFRMDGDRNQPNLRKLKMAQRLVASAAELAQRAMEYLRGRADVHEFAEGNGELVFDGGIDVGHEEGSFDLSFGFTKWPDGYVTVRFTHGQPTDVMMGD